MSWFLFILLFFTGLVPVFSFDPRKYFFFKSGSLWRDARAYCQAHYSDLAVIKGDEDLLQLQKDVLDPLSNFQIWIGMYLNPGGPWKWVDQTNMAFRWYPGQPDNYYGDENVGYLHQLQAADAHDNWFLPFLCYKVVTGHKQILRIKVESNQDINDPTIKAALLEMIQQKLKDHGIEHNITLEWRKQPDGVVFHKMEIH